MRPVTLVIAALFLLAPQPVAGQERLLLQPGQRVRVTAPDLGIKKQVATFEALHGDTLVLGGDVTMYLPLASVMRLDVSRGRERQTHRGMLIGGAIGAAAGALWGAVEPVCEISDTGNKMGCVVAGGLVLGLVGGGVGALVGASIRTDVWREIPLDRLRVSFGPQRDGRFGFGASVRF